jgi:hypothetical protein
MPVWGDRYTERFASFHSTTPKRLPAGRISHDMEAGSTLAASA